jgi:hypothetical protein
MLIILQLTLCKTFFEIILVPLTIIKSGFIAFINSIVLSAFTELTCFNFSIGISLQFKLLFLVISLILSFDKIVSSLGTIS